MAAVVPFASQHDAASRDARCAMPTVRCATSEKLWLWIGVKLINDVRQGRRGRDGNLQQAAVPKAEIPGMMWRRACGNGMNNLIGGDRDARRATVDAGGITAGFANGRSAARGRQAGFHCQGATQL